MDISEYLPMFLAEGREHLQELNLAVVRIEEQPDDPETVDEIFRIAHSMKGMSATMGFAGMAALTHEMEDVFELLRQRKGGLAREAVDVLLLCLDTLGEAVDAIEEDGAERIVPEPLIARLRELVRDRTPGQDADRHGSQMPPADLDTAAAGERVVHVSAELADDAAMPAVRAYMVLSSLAEKGRVVTSAPTEENVEAFTGRAIDVWLATDEAEDVLVAVAGSVPDVAAAYAAVVEPDAEPEDDERADTLPDAAAPTAPAPATSHKTKGASTVRVDAERLDQLMHYMGELVLHRTQVDALVAQADVPGLSQAMQNLTRTSHALQQMVMQVRMIPVEAVFLRFPRLVRDLSTKLGKQVELSLVGKETELDRTVVAHGDDHVAARVAGGDLERPGGGLAGRDALLRRLEAVVERVAHEVDERVAERVDHRAVELGLLAHEAQLDLLVELHRQVAHEPREAQEDRLDRDHADLHDHLLERVRRAREVLHGLRQARHVGLGDEALHLRAVEHELAHEVHELVQALGVDTHGRGALGLVGGGGSAGGRGGGRSRGAGCLHRVRVAGARLGRHHGRVRGGDVGHRAGERDERLLGLLGGEPHVDRAAREGVHVLLRRGGGHHAALLGERREDHVGADGRHLRVVGELGRQVHDPLAGCEGVDVGGRRLRPVAVGVLVGRAVPHQLAQAGDQRLGHDPLGAVHLDRVDGLAERVEAEEQHVDGLALQPALAPAQQLEDVLHLVRERRHAGEAHRRAHALHRVRDAEDLVDRLRIVGLLLDADDREVELLEVLAALGEEHGEVLGDVHARISPSGR